MLDGLFIGMAASQATASHAAEASASRAASVAGEARTQTELLRADVEKLLMITEALWTLMREQHGYTDEQLVRAIEDIDLRDGKLDGKVAKSPPPLCPECGRNLMGNRPVCLYCGTPVVRGPFER